MSRVQPRHLDENERKSLLDLLWTSIAELTTRTEVKSFLKDLLSEGEAIMLARRIRIAQLLLSGNSYDQIIKRLGSSRDTVAHVQHWLTSGFDGYEMIAKRFEKVIEERRFNTAKKTKQAQPYTFGWLKRRYPLHFLLFNLMDEANAAQRRRSRRKLK